MGFSFLLFSFLFYAVVHNVITEFLYIFAL
jgi:hypothetical protein